jgi:hypothetical protein
MTKRIILKDATASGYQIQTFLIGCNDEKLLKNINMGEKDIFIDTYLFIVKSFREKFNNLDGLSEKYLSRNLIKKFCMIIPYSAGFKECYSHIKSHIREEDKNEAENLFLTFYNFIKKEL